MIPKNKKPTNIVVKSLITTLLVVGICILILAVPTLSYLLKVDSIKGSSYALESNEVNLANSITESLGFESSEIIFNFNEDNSFEFNYDNRDELVWSVSFFTNTIYITNVDEYRKFGTGRIELDIRNFVHDGIALDNRVFLRKL